MISTLKKLLFVLLLPVRLAAQDGGFLYVRGPNTTGSVAGFSIDASGTLVPIPGSPFRTTGDNSPIHTPTSLAADPQGRFLFATMNGDIFDPTARMAVFAIDPSTGALSLVPGSPFTIGQFNGFIVTSSPNGNFVYVLYEVPPLLAFDTITVFAVDTTTGALTLVPGSTVPASKESAPIVMDPDNKFAYVASWGFGSLAFDGGDIGPGNVVGAIRTYAVDPTTGVLTLVPGSRIFTARPFDMKIDRTGRFLYVPKGAGVGAFASSPFPAGSRDASTITLDPTGKFAYMSDGLYIWTYAVDPGTGALTSVSASEPRSNDSIVVDSTGRFLYLQTNSDIYAYAINPATGGLSLLPGSPSLGLGGRPLIVVKPRTPNPPTSSAVPSPASTTAGWNNTTVTVDLSAVDTSGWAGVKEIKYTLTGAQTGGGVVSGASGSFSISAEGTTTVAYVATDKTGNQETPKTLLVSIDTRPPAATATASPVPNVKGWNNTNVTISFSGTDTLSGLESCTGAITLLGDGAGQSASGTCRDKAGNVSTPALMSGINIDRTPPTVGFAAPNPTPNAAGWNNTNVSLLFSLADSLSGVMSTVESSPLTLATEGSSVKDTVTATDKAGNTATFISEAVKIDKTPPAVSAQSMPLPNANGWNNTSVTTSFTASDTLSGLKTLSGPVVTAIEGAAQLVTGAATDVADNVSSVTMRLNIDKTAPEAFSQFDPATKPPQFFGRDPLSGVPAGPVKAVTCVPAPWRDDEDDDRHDATTAGERLDDPNNAQLCTATITDLAGNKLVLLEKLKELKGDDDDRQHELKAHIISTRYNNDSAVTAPNNQQDFQWSLAKDGSLKSFDQTMVVRQGKNRHEVVAKFDSKKNQTTIQVQDNSPGGKDGDKNKDDKIRKIVKPGLDLLRMTTYAGLLDVEF